MTDEEKPPPKAAPPSDESERKTARAERGAEPGNTQAKTEAPAGKAARKAARKAAKLAAKSERKAAEESESPPAGPSAAAAPTSEKKKAKKAKRAEQKEAKKRARELSEGSAGAAKSLPAAEPDPEKAARKAAKKAAMKAAKAQWKAAKEDKDTALTREERKQAKREAKAAMKATRKEAGEDDGSRPFRFKVFAANPQALTDMLCAGLAAAGVAAEARDEGRLDLAVHDFDAAPDAELYAAGMSKARLHVLIDREAHSSGALVRIAALTGAAIVHAGSKLERSGGVAGDEAERLIAEWVLAVASARARKAKFAPPPRRLSPDLVRLREACARPAEFLAQIRSAATLPKGLSARPFQDEVENLADSKIALTSEITLPLESPFNWRRELSDRRSNSTLYGLDFLIGPFAYWHAKAQARSNDQIAAIDAALKARGKTPNSVLARAMLLVDDFVAKHPREDAGPAWQDQAVLRRVRVLLLYVLCCKAALKRKIGFNEAAFAQVARALFDHVEILRDDDHYVPVSQDGIEQDSLLVAIAVALQGLPYAEQLLDDSLARLKRLQLEPGLTQEGVWQGDSFTEHCAVLGEISSLCGDIPPARAALAEPFSSAAKKMTAFAEAMLKCNGEPPGIDDSRQKSYAERLMGARRKLAKAAGKKTPKGRQPLRTRITDTYVFREAQYFISHSSTAVGPDSSLAVLHASPPSLARNDPGGITLVFAHGEANLLIRGTPPEKGEGEVEIDPALRNGIRIDGCGYREAEGGSAGQVRIVKSWRGPGWAAARGVEANHEGGSIARTAIHLKAAHALVVVDELESADGAEHDFTQHWNVAPEFQTAGEGGALHFRAEQGGTLNVTVSGDGVLTPETGEGGIRLARTLRLAKGVAASVFQWTEQPAQASLGLETGGADWTLAVSGHGFQATLALSGGDLRCELAERG